MPIQATSPGRSVAPLDLIPLEQVPDLLPPRRRRDGRKKKVHRSTIFRWADEGIAGVKLRTVRLGRTKCTRREWLDEFIDQATKAQDDGTADPAPSHRGARRDRARRTRATLDRHGLAPPKEEAPASNGTARGSVMVPETHAHFDDGPEDFGDGQA